MTFWHSYWINRGVMKTKTYIEAHNEHPRSDGGSRLISGSFILTLGENHIALSGARNIPLNAIGANLQLPVQTSNFHQLEDDTYFLLLEGNFYLETSATVDPVKNLDLFLRGLHQASLEGAARLIAGGLFNLLIFDKEKAEISVLNDRLAILPLFWMNHNDTLIITNNQLNLHNYTTISRSAILEFLKYGYLPVSPSLFNGVERLGIDSHMQASLAELSPRVKRQNRLLEIAGMHDTKDHESKWKTAFETYFKRVSGKTYLGLSGGYDSRLLAAYAADGHATGLNFGDAGSAETGIAQEIADHLKIKLDRGQFPQDAIARYAHRLSSDFRTPTSLENVHVLHLSDRVQHQDTDYYLDGYLGGAIMGDVYFHQRSSSLQGIVKYVLGIQDFSSSPQSTADYVETLYSKDKQGLADEAMLGLMTDSESSQLKKRFGIFVQSWAREGLNHEAIIERLRLFSRGRNLIANGPVSLSTHTQTLIPFLDYAIQDLSWETPRKLRFAHGLYNRFWRIAFPEMTGFRKTGTFGKPSDNGLTYRLKSLAFIIYKRMLFPLFQKFNGETSFQEEEYFSTAWYLADPENEKLVHDIMAGDDAQLPNDLEAKIRTAYQAGNINESLLMRYVTLKLLLKGNI